MGDLKRGKRKIGCCLLLPNWLAGGEHPARSAGDAGMVPLTSRETAKGGEQRTQLASLKQVSAVLQRSHPRAKRKPDPRIMHSCPEAHRWGMVGSQIMVTIMGNNLLVEPEEVCYNGGSWKREITFVSATNMNKLWTCQKSPSKKPFSEYSGKYLQKRVRKAFIYAGFLK